MPVKKNKKTFIEDAIKVHGNKYDYSKVEYTNSKDKVCIICPEHGEFYMTPNSHLRGQGCPKCGKASMAKKRAMSKEEFIAKSMKVHGDKYDYSKLEYVNSHTKVCIICPIHGEFWQIPDAHVRGVSCPKCAHRSTKYAISEWVEKARKVHGDKYDYSKVKYVNNKTKVCIICPTHGEFWQTPNSHLLGQGCRKCGINRITTSLKHTTEDFIEQSKEIHGDKYDYSKVKYDGNKNAVCIICPTHGEFWQTPHEHLDGCGCPKCATYYSKYEDELFTYIDSLGCGKIISRCRKIINPQEIDIFIPSKNIGFEYNGLIWHSEKFGKDKNYHLDKTKECLKKGIKLYHIFEDEYVEHKDIVLSKIKNIIGCAELDKRYARNCLVKEISSETAKDFLEKNHIQGYVRSTVYLGCFYNNELIGVMSFKRETKDSNNWELTRFATDINYRCVGVGGKLFKHFIKEYNPIQVKSFADRRWTLDEKDNLYTKLGFELTGILKPDYRYVRNKQSGRIHKFNMRKDRLLKHYPNAGLTPDMTEKEMCDKLGFYRIWDCGLLKYEWFNKN